MFERIAKALQYLKEFLNGKSTEYVVSVGDITEYKGDAIVNAANSQLSAGGGVCGAIFKKAGYYELQDACDKIGYTPTGCASTTPAFGLPSKYVIHAVGPIYQEGQNNESLLRGAYQSALSEALKSGAKSIAFPAISTGIYGYPLEDATRIAIKSVQEFCSKNKGIERVDFVCFSPEIEEVYKKAMRLDYPEYMASGMSL